MEDRDALDADDLEFARPRGPSGPVERLFAVPHGGADVNRARGIPAAPVRAGLKSGLMIAALGAILWVTGRPFVFPSLGPTAFMLALRPRHHPPREVLGGHLWGVSAGLVSYHVLASGLTLGSMPAAWSVEAVRLTGSAALSVALTASAMVTTRTVHAPACATTLIVSLGLLPLLKDGLVIMVGVAFLYGLHRVVDAVWRPRPSPAGGTAPTRIPGRKG